MTSLKYPIALILLAGLCHSAYAQTYVSMELGGHFAPPLSFVNTSTDRASICDEYINPLYASIPGCTDTNPGEDSQWVVDYDRAFGLTASLAIGSRMTRLVIAELEYLNHHSWYSQYTDAAAGTGVDADKLDLEVFVAREAVGDVNAHSLMLNSYAVLTPRRRVSWMPYVGAGAGLSRISMHYASTWYRNPDPTAIRTGDGLPNADQIRNNLAGTISIGNADLKDYVFAWQAMIGIDYFMTRRVSLGVKLRRVDFAQFESDNIVWDPLRSHPPNNRLDGSEPVDGVIGTADLQMVTLALVMRYHFWQ
ncbi:MAG: hypothetical protein OXI38_13625 [Bacteroidota bacterium]|nr:hypothetical protein [Bacteroidota bacterium]